MQTTPVKSSAKCRPARILFVVLCAALCLAPNCAAFQSPNPSQTPIQTSNPGPEEIIRGIDAAVLSRANAISRYTVQEQYSLFRNGETTPAAEETVQTLYVRATGKQYTPTAQSGSALLRSAVIDRVIAGEKDVNLPANREGAWLTSANYEMRPEPGRVERNGRQCILVGLKPRRKSPHLLNGKLWVDASDFTVVRLEGVPSQSPSMFAGDTTVGRDYIEVDGFSMATHAEARSHSFLLGDTLLKIDYTGYKIERSPAASATIP